MVRICLISGLIVCLLVASLFSQAVPAWVNSHSEFEGENAVFVASGDDPTGNVGAAEKVALQNLIGTITTYLGAKVTAESTATARATADAYQAQVVRSITSSSKNQITGLRVSDRYTLKSPPSVTVYLKALYNKTELEAEKKRVKDLFDEVQASVARPEAEGDRSASEGQIFEAVRQYLTAAGAALNPEIDNGAVKFERNLAKARALIPRISLIALSGPQKTSVGQRFPKTFDVKVVSGTDTKSLPLAGVPLRFAYKVQKNNRTTVAGISVTTDEQGIARFSFPSPDAVVKDNLLVTLDLAASFEALLLASPGQQNLVSGLEDQINQARLSVAYQVESAAKNIALELSVTEVHASSSLADALTKAGFKVAKKTPPRLVYGAIEVVEVSDNDGLMVCRVEGTIRVVSRTDEAVLFTKSVAAAGTGKDKKSATDSAYRQWGTEAGAVLVNGAW